MKLQADRLAEHFPALSSPALLAEVAAAGLPAQLPAGATVCHLGQECTHLALLFSGTARVYQVAETGREITLYRVGAGECCILTASCIMSLQHFPAIAVCEAATEGLLIPAPQVDAWMARFPEWRRFIWGLMADRLSSVLCLLEEVTFRRVDRRIANYLVQAAEQQHSDILALTHQTIADDLGTSREVVSRILKDLEQSGMLSLSRGRVQIKHQALAASLCD